jgi:A/G-specific adenine glycosylase
MVERKNVKRIQSALLSWYGKEKRDLPWRDSRDPYAIWVSEIMLQQTQVKTVIPYYRRWISAFPTLQMLARAPEEKILKLWEGLGYYTRARNLHRAAKQLTADGNGKMPETLEEILALPGVGRYTAGAILSIAFGQPLPVLDGNVKRVLSRLLLLRENGVSVRSANRLWKMATALVPKRNPGDFNQALMELGAVVCLPKNPLCGACPLKSICKANAEGVQQRYPPVKPRPITKQIEVSAGVILRSNKVFIQQRLRGGLMGGLWEFPGGKREAGETLEACLQREIREELSVDIRIEEKVMTIRHAYTRFRVTLHVYLCKLVSGRIRAVECEQWQWVAVPRLGEFAYPAANLKIVEYLQTRHAGPQVNRRKRNYVRND